MVIEKAVKILQKLNSLIRSLKRFIYTLEVKVKSKSYGENLRVNYRSKVYGNVFLGENVNFNGITIKGGGEVRIGSNFHSGTDCLIISQIHNYDSGHKIPYDNTYILKPVNIGENVWIGDRVIILGGVNIGEGAIIQAGSCVVNDIPKFCIAGGHPAKVFGQRDIEHYKKLKLEGKFH